MDCGELGETPGDNGKRDVAGGQGGYARARGTTPPSRPSSQNRSAPQSRDRPSSQGGRRSRGGQLQAVAGYKTTYQIVKPGRGGTKVRKGSNVLVHATGVVKESGKKFWSTKDPGQEPFGYQAGVGGVITGWDQGCLGMEVGEVRELLIPAEEGYGSKGFPAWGIPPGGTLNFTLECLKIK